VASICRDGDELSYSIIIADFLNTCVTRPFEKFVDWRQCAAIMQREAVTVMLSCSGGGNVVVE
jgi:hypothetical protein